MAGQLVLALTILVGIHEFGHFIAARMFGMRVDKFFIFFDAKFNLYSKKVGDTEYGIGWIPLGGYVKIAGMMDESMDKEQLSKPAEPWEFRSKPAWQRLIVMIGGVTMNVILGMIAFIMLVAVNGESYLPASEMNKHGIIANELGQEIGLQTGDKILAINGKELERYTDLLTPEVIMGDDIVFNIDRNGEQIDIPIPDGFAEKLIDGREAGGAPFVEFRMPFEVGNIAKGMNAEKAGLQEGDKIISINDKSINYFDELRTALLNQKGNTIQMEIVRKGITQVLNVDVDTSGIIGFNPKSLLALKTDKFGLGESIIKGTEKAWGGLAQSIWGIGKIISGKVPAGKALNGPLGIAKIYGAVWDWTRFWTLTGMLSMWLAFINIVPIPALDGGHVMFLLYEIIVGRKPNEKFMEYMQMAGMILLFALMAYVIFNDVIKLAF